jgi:hypothetical protein
MLTHALAVLATLPKPQYPPEILVFSYVTNIQGHHRKSSKGFTNWQVKQDHLNSIATSSTVIPA